MSDLDRLLEAAQKPGSGDGDPASKAGAPPVESSGDGGRAVQRNKSQHEGALPKADKYIKAFYYVLCLISLVELYSASSREVTSGNVYGPLLRHGLMLLMGITICIGVSRVQIKYLVLATPYFVGVSVLMAIYVLIAGNDINGAVRSFSLMGITIQPSEFLKLSAVLIVAYFMSRNQEKGGVKNIGVVKSASCIILFGALLFTQGLTNTILLMAISLSMMLIGGIQWKKFGVVMLVYAVVAGAGMALKIKMDRADDKEETKSELAVKEGDNAGNGASRNRSRTWNSRWDRFTADTIPKYMQKITSENRQEMYSYMAQAHGGIYGVLPGHSRETSRLPLAFSDYIFSIVVEDWGFIGGMILLLIYLSLLGRAGTIAYRCNRRAFPAMLIMGMAVMIVFQALFHMAIVTGVFPVSGQPLPMISKGGTSILVTSLAFGVMLSVSRYVASLGEKPVSGAVTRQTHQNNK